MRKQRRCFQSLTEFLKIREKRLCGRRCETCSQQTGQSFPSRGLHAQSPGPTDSMGMGGTRVSPAAGSPCGFLASFSASTHTPPTAVLGSQHHLSLYPSPISGQPHFAAAPRTTVRTGCCCAGGGRGDHSTVAPPTCRPQTPTLFTTPCAPWCQVAGRLGQKADLPSLSSIPGPSQAAVLKGGLRCWQQHHLKLLGPKELLASPAPCDSAGCSCLRAPR